MGGGLWQHARPPWCGTCLQATSKHMTAATGAAGSEVVVGMSYRDEQRHLQPAVWVCGCVGVLVQRVW